MRAFIPGLVLVLPFGLAAQEQPIEAGRQYAGGARVASPAAGVSFAIPAGFAGAYDGEASAFLMASQARPNTIVGVFAYSDASGDEVAEVIYEILQAQNITLRPRGAPTTSGTTVSALYDAMTPQGPGVLYGTIRSGPAGNAMAVVAFGPPTAKTAVRELADGIVGTGQFTTPLAHQWRSMLGGTRLVKGATSSNYSPGGVGNAGYASQNETRYDFCRDGTYAYYSRSESYISVEGAGSAERVSQDEHQGRWRLVADIVGGATLVLRATDGREFYVAVQEGQDAVLLDGTSYGYQPSPLCR